MKNYLKFWGTRGSCSVSGPDFAQFGGNSCSLEIRYEDTLLIVDAGTGIRPFGRELAKEGIRNIHLFLTHTHWDHLIGFPFFEPIYDPGTHITIWLAPNIQRTYRELFSDLLLAPEFFPIRFEQVQAMMEFQTIQQKTPISLGSLTLDFHTTNHPGLTFCVKVKTPHFTFGYSTDNEMLQGHHGTLQEIPPDATKLHESLIDFLKPCDLLVHEAQYTPEEYKMKVAWGHSSTVNATYLLQRCQTPHWIVTHHDPSHSDQELYAMEAATRELLKENKIHCKVEWIRDGHVVSLK